MKEQSEVEKISNIIREKNIKGSTDIALAAVNALLEDAENYDPSCGEPLKVKIADWGIMLKRSRPGLITLQNGIMQAVSKINNTGSDEGALELLRSNVKKFKVTAETAEGEISKFGSNIIQDGDNVLTISHSKMVLAIMKRAKIERNKQFKVWVVETRPRYQGVDMARALSSLGIPTSLIADSAIRHFIKSMNVVFVGADTISSDGSIITKIGASQMALIAHEARVPFYVAAPTYKFSMDTFSGITIKMEEGNRDEMLKTIPIPEGEDREEFFKGIEIRNPSFDVTPREYIRGIITERYIMSPHSVGEYVVKQSYDIPK